MTGATRRAMPVLGTLALPTIVFAVAMATAPTLPAPPLHSVRALGGWLEATPPTVAALTLLRVSALLAAAHLITVAALGAIAALAGLPRACRGLAVATLPRARRALHAASAMTLAALPLAPAAGSASAPTPPAAARPLHPPSTADRHVAVMRPLDTHPVGRSGEAAPDPATAVERSWTIEAGDHLWSVSRRTLESTLGRSPSDREVATYLDRLVVRNHSVLAVPSQPDLVFAGQTFVLPEVDP